MTKNDIQLVEEMTRVYFDSQRENADIFGKVGSAMHDVLTFLRTQNVPEREEAVEKEQKMSEGSRTGTSGMTDNLCTHKAWTKIDGGTRCRCFHCGYVPPDNKPALSSSLIEAIEAYLAKELTYAGFERRDIQTMAKHIAYIIRQHEVGLSPTEVTSAQLPESDVSGCKAAFDEYMGTAFNGKITYLKEVVQDAFENGYKTGIKQFSVIPEQPQDVSNKSENISTSGKCVKEVSDTLNRLAQDTLDYFEQQARRDDWHTRFVGSDIRMLIGEIRRLQKDQRGEISVHPALAAAAEILANFKTEGNKLEEWQACYAKLFTQMNEICNQKREAVDGKIARLLHYPEHWDIMAYPTLYDAVNEMHTGCSVCRK